MPLTNPDAKDLEASSSSTANGQDTHADSSAQTQEPSLADVAREAYEKATQAEATRSTEEPKEKKESESLSDPNAKAPEGETDDGEESSDDETEEDAKEGEEQANKEGEVKTEGKVDDKKEPIPDEKLPFHNHPRWQEVLSQRNQFEEKAKQLEPVAQKWQYHESFLQKHGISAEEVAFAMNYLATKKLDPAAARQMLEPEWNNLREFDPNAIPADIQQMVDNNEMTEKAAKEMAKMRAQLNAQQRGSALSAEQQQRNLVKSISDAQTNWDMSKRATDPDFRPKATKEEPDGLWEMTAKGFAYLQTMNFAKDPQTAISNLEQAYKDAKGVVARMATARTPTKKRPTSARSSSPAKKREEDMTTAELVASVAASHGITWDPSNSD